MKNNIIALLMTCAIVIIAVAIGNAVSKPADYLIDLITQNISMVMMAPLVCLLFMVIKRDLEKKG